MFETLIRKNRSYRRFHQDVRLERSDLEGLVELARLSPSAANLQPLKFFLSTGDATNQKIFPCLKWAGYLKNWDGPEEGERPAAYIVILQDLDISKRPDVDHGIAAQSILLGAVEKGWGGCMIGNVVREKLRDTLSLPPGLEILLVLALGKPKEEVVLDEIKGGDIKYWRDPKDVHHVPKRSLGDLIVN